MKKSRISIDLETLGTNVDSQILSIGACVFDLSGTIHASIELPIKLPKDRNINATPGTIEFWLSQATSNPTSVLATFNNPEAEDLMCALGSLSRFIRCYNGEEIWANGTKFDLGMLEYQYKLNFIDVPWTYNADCCMRTLRRIVGNLEVDFRGVAHNSRDDAIWQAKYIAQALTKLGVTE